MSLLSKSLAAPGFLSGLILAAVAASPSARADDAPAVFAAAGSSWTGTNKLWLRNPKKPLLSEGRATLAENTVTYTWAYKGAPQTGSIALSGPPDARVAVFTDTWHSPQPMNFTGTTKDGRTVLLGSYSVGGGKPWGWRIELTETPDAFTMRMFNLPPDRTEEIAVEMIGKKAPSP